MYDADIQGTFYAFETMFRFHKVRGGAAAKSSFSNVIMIVLSQKLAFPQAQSFMLFLYI
jgi:hypothetical protein